MGIIRLFGIITAIFLFAGLGALAQPSGFYKVKSNYNVELWRKDYSGGKPDFVIVADISAGAQLLPITGAKSGSYAYNSNFPAFKREYISYFWDNLKNNAGSDAFAVINAGFFDARISNTSFSHYQKINGSVVSNGHDGRGSEKWLVIKDNAASIYAESSGNSINSIPSNSTHVVGGMDIYEKGTGYDERTFVGIGGTKTSSGYSKIFIFTSLYAKPSNIISVLNEFGAVDFVMLDGGGSTQMICEGSTYVASSDNPDRKVPHAIGIISGINSGGGSSEQTLYSDKFTDKVASFWNFTYGTWHESGDRLKQSDYKCSSANVKTPVINLSGKSWFSVNAEVEIDYSYKSYSKAYIYFPGGYMYFDKENQRLKFITNKTYFLNYTIKDDVVYKVNIYGTSSSVVFTVNGKRITGIGGNWKIVMLVLKHTMPVVTSTILM
jgi:hypothetical protein